MTLGKVHITKRFRRYRQFNPERCTEGSYRTVPLSHTPYKGTTKKGDEAIVCKVKGKKHHAWQTQSILKNKTR
jgi:hypothetical protein